MFFHVNGFRRRLSALLSAKLRGPLFQKRARSLPHIVGGRAQAEKRRFEILAFRKGHFRSGHDLKDFAKNLGIELRTEDVEQ